MRRAAAIGVVCLLLGACVGSVVGNRFRPEVYVVRPGDTLYSIAWRYRIDHKDLMRWNDIDDPRNLQLGRHLRLRPEAAAGGAGTTTTATTSTRTGASPDTTASTTANTTSGSVSSGSASASRDTSTASSSATREPAGDPPGRWRWPTRGSVVGTFADGRVAGRGVDIAGKVGQPVHATAAGEVVYSGDGLKAYGRLLIVRHEGDFLSAYAHNSELLVAEGDRVEAGQPIARMGRTRDGGALLHFEIRRGGSPVDPLDYLPERD